ncbi:MAG TPA: hypothetical protein P5116_02385 [Eubacteriales bacterium]|nr:hypothetical protein [Eubacteriales bacterium]
MNREKKSKSPDKRRRLLFGTRFGPWLSVLLCLALLVGAGLLFYYFGLPFCKTVINMKPDLSSCIAKEPEPSAEPTAKPTAVPTEIPGIAHALYGCNLASAQVEVIIPEYQYLADYGIVDNTLYFVGGNYTQDGTAAFVCLLLYNLESRSTEYLKLPLEYKSLRGITVSHGWICYADVMAAGGGRLMAYNRASGEAVMIKTLHLGIPRLALWENYLCFVERSGSTRDKLYVIDLETMEHVTLEIFNSSDYALSAPCMAGGALVYADPNGLLTTLDLETGDIERLDCGMYIHDPKTNGELTAYLSGSHGEDTGLYYLDVNDKPVLVAEGVVDFAVGEDFIAYECLDKVFVYFVSDGATFCITRSDEQAQLLTAGGEYVCYMDVTWRDKDITEFMNVINP